MSGGDARLGVVTIGRNEGERLKTCLRSLRHVPARVYVDSGSTDGSQDHAAHMGTMVVPLSVPPGFTAARARNAGLEALLARWPDVEFVQMVDGDCEVEPGWLAAATAALDRDPGLAVVFGRRRERYPDQSLYNRICDVEWNVPVGEALSCGGDALFRVAPLVAAGGYDATLIAGEEPDLCLRLRRAGWRIARIDAAMTVHDAAITRFGQFQSRARRAGYAFAEHVRRNGRDSIPGWPRELARIRLWAMVLPALVLTLLVCGFWAAPLLWAALLLALLYPLQILRMGWRDRHRFGGLVTSIKAAGLMAAARFAQATGVRRFAADRRRRRSSGLIEYKRS